MVVTYIGLGWILFKLQKLKNYHLLALFMLNPLVLIETITNIHNDVVMMLLELVGIYLIWQGWLKHSVLAGLTGIIIFLLSVSIKYASFMLLPGWLLYWVIKKLKGRMDIGGVLAVTHFLPLLSNRSQRFLPWYLIWPMTFIPLTNQKLIQNMLVITSFSALMSYVPYLYYLEFSPGQQFQRFWLLFGIPLMYLIFQLVREIRLRKIKIRMLEQG
jgi:hypothetical protein